MTRFPLGPLPLGNSQSVDRASLSFAETRSRQARQSAEILIGGRFLVDSFGGHNEINPAIKQRSNALGGLVDDWLFVHVKASDIAEPAGVLPSAHQLPQLGDIRRNSIVRD